MLLIAVRGWLIGSRVLKLAVILLLLTHGHLFAMAPASGTNFNFDADIVRATCQVDGPHGFLSLGNIKPAELRPDNHTTFNVANGAGLFKISCGDLKEIKVSFTPNSPRCEKGTLLGWLYSCAGPNLTVGMAPEATFVQRVGGEMSLSLKHDIGTNRYDLKVTDGVAEINIKRVRLSRLKDTAVEYGPISASFTFTLSAD